MDALKRSANVAYFQSGVWQRTTWMGVPTVKCPGDLWVYQELIVAGGCDLVVETGSWKGGSALYFAHVFDALGRGEVISVDVEAERRPEHERITWIHGDSVAPEVVAQVAEAAGDKRVMVILDSDHRSAHVLAELRAYGPLVSPGCWLIVEDTCFDGVPVWPEFGPGPAAAVADYLADGAPFDVDPDAERHLLTFAPGGFLRRRPA